MKLTARAAAWFVVAMADTLPPWLPARAAVRPGGLYIVLRAIGPEQLQDAFMFETLARVQAEEALVPFSAEDGPPAAPAGMIFHVGRSGSTVMSQLLKQHGGVTVYSEPQAFNELIVPPHRGPREQIVGGLRLLASAFAKHAGKPFVIKFSSWNTFYCDLFAEAFPQTPFVFNTRDPLEVAVSLLKGEPGWFNDTQATSRALQRLADPKAASRSREEFVARVFASSCDAVARLDPTHGILVSHEELPAASWERAAAHFGLAADDPALARMQAQSGAYAKAKLGAESAYEPDSEAKRAAATPELRLAIDTIARPALERLRVRYA
ncbi:MAG: hypothetical protein AB7G05_04905 [Hyphomonadaceae bacterium]